MFPPFVEDWIPLHDLPKLSTTKTEDPSRDDTGKKIYVPWKKIHVPWKKYLQPLEKKFRLLWPCGPLAVWSFGPLVLWLFGPLVLWSSGPVVLWSCGRVVLWSSGPKNSMNWERIT